MKPVRSFLTALALAGMTLPAVAAEKPEFLAAFDPASDAIQLEYENQVDPACFWRPYHLRDAIAAEMERLGLKSATSSLYVLDVMSWGMETDDYHCAVVLDMRLRRHGVRAEVSPDRAVSTELLLWDESEMLFGPKIHMQEQLENKAFELVGTLFKALR
ncbi:MAG: hypothetical protein P8Y54_04765 [Xanthomonadales bacterium]